MKSFYFVICLAPFYTLKPMHSDKPPTPPAGFSVGMAPEKVSESTPNLFPIGLLVRHRCHFDSAQVNPTPLDSYPTPQNSTWQTEKYGYFDDD
jgi:hypothetical protein